MQEEGDNTALSETGYQVGAAVCVGMAVRLRVR